MTTPPLQTLRNQADQHAKHTRGCKKPLDGCPTCVAVVAWFREIPAPILNLVLADRGKPVKQGSY